MRIKNISFLELLKIFDLQYDNKHKLLMYVLEYEIETGISRKDAYFNLFNDRVSWSDTPLFETPEQVGEFIENGKL